MDRLRGLGYRVRAVSGPGRVIVDMPQHKARVHQVKSASWRLLRAQVMPQHFDIDPAARGQHPDIHIGRHDTTGIAGPLRQPGRDGPATRADLPALLAAAIPSWEMR